MKKLLILFMLSVGLFADSINVTAGVGSKHFLPYELNEQNGGIGIGYEYNYNEDIAINADYIKFTNSYNKPTQFTGLTINYTPIRYKELKLGGFIGTVYNDGYCGFYDVCKDDMSDTGFLPIGGAVVQIDNFIVKGMTLPSEKLDSIDAVVWLVQFKAVEF